MLELKFAYSLEPEIREYLIRIVNTIAILILWLTINSTAGIMFDYAFIKEGLTIGNVIFYIWFIGSGCFVAWYLIRLWSKPLDIPR